MIDLHKTIEQFSGLVDELFNKIGYVQPTYFVYHNGDWQHVPTPWEYPKEVVAMAMRKLLQTTRAEAYVFMDEAWVVEAKEVNLDVAPSEHPDRREIVVITAEDETSQLLARRNILRPTDGKPSLAPLEIYGDGKLEGDMTNLMSRREDGDTVH
jgi:hypothetical protein